MGEKAASVASILVVRANIGVPDEGYVLNLLKAHYTHQGPSFLVAPEHDSIVYFMPEFLRGHIRFCPAIRGDDPLIGLGGVVDDGPNQLEIAVVAESNHENTVWQPGIFEFI
jgi:hypothetical protein